MKEEDLVASIERLRVQLGETGDVLKGSLSAVRPEKGKGAQRRTAGCLLTYKGKGNKTQSLYIRKGKVPEAKRMIRNYKQAKKNLEGMVEMNVILFKVRRE
jgi:hypothetical protein